MNETNNSPFPYQPRLLAGAALEIGVGVLPTVTQLNACSYTCAVSAMKLKATENIYIYAANIRIVQSYTGAGVEPTEPPPHLPLPGRFCPAALGPGLALTVEVYNKLYTKTYNKPYLTG